MDWDSIYAAYPVNREMIWLNNCGTTPAGSHVVDAVSRFMEGYARKGMLTEAAGYSKVRQRIKFILSALLNCSPDELCLIHNTAEGMNFISHGLKLSAGDEVILLENEYPSNVYPWWHLRRKGVKLVTTPMGTTPDDFFRKFESSITAKTRAASLSAVHWCTGMPLPLSRIGRLCRQRGVDLVVDGAQGVGVQPLDVKKDGVGYMAFSAWKWLLGPLGLGVLYVSEERLDELDPIFIGTSSVVRESEYLPYKSELKPTADRFLVSTANFSDWVYFEAALDFLHHIGFAAVRERIFDLSEHLANGLRRIGFEILSDRFPDSSSGIVVCETPTIAANVVLQHLAENKIVAAERLGRIRFSPHVYNSTRQLDRVVRVLERFTRNSSA